MQTRVKSLQGYCIPLKWHNSNILVSDTKVGKCWFRVTWPLEKKAFKTKSTIIKIYELTSIELYCAWIDK